MKRLKKDLTLLGVFCVATGAMISSGLFILPGLAFAQAGPAVIISYAIAAFLCIPALLSTAELTTAMPKAGGDYFYIMRGFGPLVGTIAGFSSWFSLSFKGAFALLGIGAYLSLLTYMPLNIIAAWFCLFFVLLNLVGLKFAGRFQIAMVAGLLSILGAYVAFGIGTVNQAYFTPMFPHGPLSVFSAASFVFISYGGLIKVAALAEEVENPGRNLPLGMLFSLSATALVYLLVIYTTIGILHPHNLSTSLTPISDAAAALGGNVFAVVIGIAALLAFITTANAGIMTASRYPLGMSRDKLLPVWFARIGARFKTPYISILTTGAFILAVVLFLRLEVLVKIASSILILLYLFANLTLILFRESKLLSYKPKFKAPLYPYVQIFGIVGCLFLLVEMGTFIIFVTMIFLLCAIGWYKIYAQKCASQDSALIHVLERLVARDKELASDNLLTELKDIVVQRDEMGEDRFHALIESSVVLDIAEPLTLTNFFEQVAARLSAPLGINPKELLKRFVEREKESSTLLRPGLAIPHIVVDGEDIFTVLLARAQNGVIFPGDSVAHIIFVLVGSPDVRNVHLRVLAAIAQITQGPAFDEKWLAAANADELKSIVLLAERRRN